MHSIVKLFFLLTLTICNTAWSNTTPVFFIHRGNPDYLKHSLWQAKQYNERVILLGDRTNAHYKSEGVEHYSIDDYFEEAKTFGKIYQHKSSNPYKYELFCFQRWFVLKAFIAQHKIPLSFYADSDIMLYCDVNLEANHYQNQDISLISFDSCSSGHSSFFTQTGINTVCQSFTDFYKKFNVYKHQYNHISDMDLLKRATDEFGSIGKLNVIKKEGVFDGNMRISHGFQMKDKIKNILWIDQQPYGYNKELNQWVRFNSLHFQGNNKPKMASYRSPKPSTTL